MRDSVIIDKLDFEIANLREKGKRIEKIFVSYNLFKSLVEKLNIIGDFIGSPHIDIEKSFKITYSGYSVYKNDSLDTDYLIIEVEEQLSQDINWHENEIPQFPYAKKYLIELATPPEVFEIAEFLPPTIFHKACFYILRSGEYSGVIRVDNIKRWCKLV